MSHEQSIAASASAVWFPSAGRWRGPAAAVLLVVVTCLAYWPALDGGFILDDDLLLGNDLVKDPRGLYRMWFTKDPIDYWPLSNSSLWIEWRLWHENPFGYHVTNLVIHIAVSLLVWAALRQLAIPGAFLAALLFAVHPVNVDSVAWISQRKTLMAMLFFLPSIMWYVKSESSTARQPWYRIFASPWYWLSLIAFVLGMLSKASVATLPLVLLLIVWWRNGQITRQDVLRTMPFVLLVAPLVLMNMWFQDRHAHQIVRSFTERLAGAGAIPWFYLGKALWPVNLVFIYPLWEIDVRNPVWWLPLVASIGVTGALWWQRHTAWGRALLFAWGFYWLALAPVLGFADVSYMKWSLVADHYQYLALVSVVALVAVGMTQIIPRVFPQATAVVPAASATFVVLLVFLTWRQSAVYRDPFTLYEATIRGNPSSPIAYYNLGHLLFQQGQLAESIPRFQTALELNPDDPEAANNLGLALAGSGRVAEAVEHIRRSLAKHPDNVAARNNLGMILLDAEQPRQAIDEFERSLARRPQNNADAQYGLGTALVKLEQLQPALEHFQQAVQIHPDFPEAQFNLGLTLLHLGRPQEAIAPLEHALQLKYREADTNLNLGIASVRSGRLQEGIQRFERAIQLQPDHASAWANLASATAGLDRRADALTMGQKALDLARAQGQAELVEQIESWLTAYRAGHSTPPAVP